MNTSNVKNGTAPVIHKADINLSKNSSSHMPAMGKKIPNRKHTVIKSKIGKTDDNSRGNSRSIHLNGNVGGPESTHITATLSNKNGNLDRTYITEDTDIAYNKVNTRGGSRGDKKVVGSREKSGTGKRLPPGVRLYNQSKNPKGKLNGKKKNDTPPKPVLTKNVEEMLLQSNRE